jgi:hypothetical protein
MLIASKTPAQTSVANSNISNEAFSIAVSPLTIFEFEPTINLHFMYAFKKKYAAAIELGRIVNYARGTNYLQSEYTGWRIRPEFRFVTPKRNNGNTYLALQGLFKSARKLYSYEYRSTPSGSQYIEAVESPTNKTVWGMNFLFGQEASFFKSKEIFSDIFTGLGFRSKHFKDNKGTDFTRNGGFGSIERNGVFLTASFGFRVRYIARRK